MPQVNGSDARVVGQLVNCLGIGGTERQFVEMLRQLDDAAWRPEVMCLQKVGELLEELAERGIDPPEYHLQGTLLKANTFRQAMRISRRLREERSALLHTHDFYSNVVGSIAARMARLPIVVSRRDLGAWLDPMRARLLAFVTQRADHVLCNAWAIRDRLVDHEGLDPDRITVIPNGLDLERFDERARAMTGPALPDLKTGWNVALVANMKHALKGQTDLLDAAPRVLAQVPDARFVLVGDGALRASLETRARTLGIRHRVLFTGRREDVPALLSRCQVLVSASWSEGLSNAVMEGMAASLPVVATAVGGNLELVRDGRSGFLVPKSEPQALAQRLIELARAPQMARRMGELGRRRIESELSARQLGVKTGALYRRLLLSEKAGSRRAA